MGLLNKAKIEKEKKRKEKEELEKNLNQLEKVLRLHYKKEKVGSFKHGKIKKALKKIEKVQKGEEELDDFTIEKIEEWASVIKECVEVKKKGDEKKLKKLLIEEEKLLRPLLTFLIYGSKN